MRTCHFCGDEFKPRSWNAATCGKDKCKEKLRVAILEGKRKNYRRQRRDYHDDLPKPEKIDVICNMSACGKTFQSYPIKAGSRIPEHHTCPICRQSRHDFYEGVW